MKTARSIEPIDDDEDDDYDDDKTMTMIMMTMAINETIKCHADRRKRCETFKRTS